MTFRLTAALMCLLVSLSSALAQGSDYRSGTVGKAGGGGQRNHQQAGQGVGTRYTPMPETAVARNADHSAATVRQGRGVYRAVRPASSGKVKATFRRALDEATTRLLRSSGRAGSHLPGSPRRWIPTKSCCGRCYG